MIFLKIFIIFLGLELNSDKANNFVNNIDKNMIIMKKVYNKIVKNI